MTGQMEKDIDWEKFDADFVKLEPGIKKRLRLTNWRQGYWFSKPGLRFDVLAEDGKPANKTFSTTSRRLIRALRPFIQRAEENGNSIICLSILRAGDRMDTVYEVMEDV